MDSKIVAFQNELDKLTVDFHELFGELSGIALNWKPNPETWSIGQVVDHIIKTNESYYPIFEGLQKGTYTASWVRYFGFLVRFFGNFILKSVEPTRQKKIKTFNVWKPSMSTISDDIVQKFVAQQKELSAKIIENQDFILRGSVISSPANRIIVYTLERAIEIIIAHEKRHLNQAEELLILIHQKNI